MATPEYKSPITNQNMITAAFKQQYHDSFEIALQQTESALSSFVVNRGQISGASFTINDMDKVEMSARSYGDRFGQTPLVIPKAGTRMAVMTDYDLFIPIEPFDLPKLSAAPDSPYMKLMVAAANRAKDDLIYKSFFADIQRREEIDAATVAGATGTWQAQKFGKDYAGTKDLGQVINASKNVTSGTNDPKYGQIDKATLIKLRALFMRTFADDEEIYVTYNDVMLQQILADTELTNADYMAIQMLQSGDVGGKWLGLNFVKYQRLGELDKDGKDVAAGTGLGYKAAVFTKSALHFGTGINYSTDVQTRPDLRNIKQLSAQMSFGAGRANELKVAQLNFVKS